MDDDKYILNILGITRIFDGKILYTISPEDEEVTISSENAPSDWSASYYFDGVEYLTTQTFTLFNYIPAEFEIVVNPGSSIGFVKYTLEVKSANFPNAPPATPPIAD